VGKSHAGEAQGRSEGKKTSTCGPSMCPLQFMWPHFISMTSFYVRRVILTAYDDSVFRDVVPCNLVQAHSIPI